MTDTKQDSPSPLATTAQIERVLWKCTDDLAVSLARSFERFEERMDSMENRLLSRVDELSDSIVARREQNGRSAR